MNRDEYIAQLERRVSELEGRPEVEVTDEHEGRLVMCRNYESEPWVGPYVLLAVLDERIDAKFRVPGAKCRMAKLYTGPTRPNWIEHGGDEIPPLGSDELDILVQRRDGLCEVVTSGTPGWAHYGRGSDIMRFTTIDARGRA